MRRHVEPDALARSRPFAGREWRRAHRVFKAGAVLAVVNALRSASTRPPAGPAGIDNRCARRVSALARCAGLSVRQRGPDQY